MRGIKNIFLASICLFFFIGKTTAQNYPVHLTTQLVAPFSGYLSDYANAGEEKLKVLMLFTDFTKPNYTVKLKISIQGQGISIQSKSYFFAGPFHLQPGVPVEISGSELYDLLNSQNLDFNGISKTTYEQRKVLPEGFYTFCITAYDFNNPIPIQVSNNSCAQGWMILSDPPFLNLPVCGSTVTPTNPQQQTFSFTQMNMGSPNSAANTDYVFELWEVRPQNAIPNNIVQTVPPIYSYTTNLNVVNYGITEPPLLLGMQYVWRVRAIDITGRDLFKNQGYSQICTFTYGSVLDGANINLNLHGQALSQRQIKVWWDSLPIFSSYNLEFRKAGSGGNWYPTTTSNHSLRILDLEPQTTYEVHVQGIGSDYTSAFSPVINVTTLAVPNYQCGEMPVVPNSSQFQPLTVAGMNSIWQIGQFEMRITHLQNMISNTGTYSGLGQIRMPLVGNVNCKFTNVVVNSDQVVVGGKVLALTEGVDAWVNSNTVGTIQDGTVGPEVQVNSPVTTSDINVNTSNGTFTVGGNTYTYTPSGSTIEDSNGNLYVVTSDGQVIYAGTAGTGNGPVPESKNIINTAKGTIAFKANASQLYGLDEYTHPELVNYYLKVKNVTDNTHPAVNWKSVMAQKYDVMDIDYSALSSSLKADSILFRTGTGTVYKPQGSGNSRKLYVIGSKHGDVQELFACYKVKADSFVNIAKINIVAYRQEQNKVTLVPLGNNISIDKTQLQKQLNDIYKQSIAAWTVDVAPPITVGDTMWDKDGNGHLNAGSNLFSRYSYEMKAINKYLRAQPYYNAREYYLVVSNKPADSLSSEIQGEMPRGRNIGYIFSGSPSANLIAHELGHGAFALEHSFDGNAKLPKSSSACLMDYSNGTELYKGKYWDYVHSPTTVIGVLEDDEQAEYVDNRKTAIELLAQIKNAYIKNLSVNLSGQPDFSYIDNYKLDGIDYTRISISIESKTSVTPKNHFASGTYSTAYGGNVSTPRPCLVIDGKMKIFTTPDTKLPDLIKYLNNVTPSENLLLFVNGYDLTKTIVGDEVYSFDPIDYWDIIDDRFINVIGTKNVVYANGNKSISTSNHKTTDNFTASMFSAQYANNPSDTRYHDDSKVILNTTPNAGGFNERFQNGISAGNNLLTKILNGKIIFNPATDSLDIVCHSMGFAYAQGMISVLKPANIKLGRYYILAPENGCSGNVNPNNFEVVWQYGCNDNPGGDPKWNQDGVAPQCKVGGLTENNRTYIPFGQPKGFTESHTIKNYGWIFEITDPIQKGYVKKRH